MCHKITNFHFEVAADLINDEELELLGNLGTDSVDIGDLAKIIGWGEDPED